MRCLILHGKVLNHFWHNHIDPAISNTTTFRTTVAFILLELIIVNTRDSHSIPQFLTKNIIETAIKVLSKIESSTEEEAVILTVLERLVSVAKDEPVIQGPILRLLLNSPGIITFDKITG